MIKELATMLGNGTIDLSITVKGNNVVTSMKIRNSSGDSALDKVPPFTMKGTLDEIDVAFLSQVRTPIELTTQIMNASAEYEKGMKERELETKRMTEKKDKIKKIMDKYEELKKAEGFNYGDPTTKTKIDKLRLEMKLLDPTHSMITEILFTSAPSLF